MNRVFALFLAAIVVLLGGCATEVVVEGSVPRPLGEKLPVNAHLVLDDAFKTYGYVEEEGSHEVSFSIGSAQANMFRTVAAALFADLAETPSVKATKGYLNLYPKVEEIQLATPFGNQLKVFEVWIKYDIQVYDDRGELLADWIMTAYGKTPTRFLGSDEAALNQAAVVALRDAGARITLELPRVPEVRNWLNSQGYAADDNN